MTTICYYISDYGYGHATRSIAIIRSLLGNTGRDLRLFVCGSAKLLPFLRESLEPDDRIRYRETASDLGYILRGDNLEPDVDRFRMAYWFYISKIPELARHEQAFLLKMSVSLVVSDISPIPIAAARLCRIPSIGISNFTWYTAYKSILAPEELQPLYEAYARMTRFISLPGAQEPAWGSQEHVQPVEFFCRPPDIAVARELRNRLNPDGSKRIVFFPIGMSIDAKDLQKMKLWQDDTCLFIVSSNMEIESPLVHSIPASVTETQHYVLISDLVISKPGWGTVSEAVCLGRPLLLIDRHHFEEDQNTIDALDKISHPYQLVNWELLQRMQATQLFASDSLKYPADPRLELIHYQLNQICSHIQDLIS